MSQVEGAHLPRATCDMLCGFAPVIKESMPAATSPKDTPCLYCGKLLTARGVSEHERHHCKKNPRRVKRSFGKKICKFCGKQLHGAALRAHMATQHPLEFARLEAGRPSSRAAKRRELYARAKESARDAVSRSRERDATAPHSSSVRKPSARRLAAPADIGKPRGSKPEKRNDGRATKHAWEEIEQKMSRAAAA